VSTPPPARNRRELTVAVLASALAGALALLAGGQTWQQVTVTRQPPLPSSVEDLTGSAIAPLVPATGLVLLAAALALFAVHGIARRVVGLLQAVAGAVLVVSGVRVLVRGRTPEVGDLASTVGVRGADLSGDVHAAWPVIAVLGGVLGVLAGLVVVLRSRAWPAMASAPRSATRWPTCASSRSRPTTSPSSAS